jgi:hypothetical protein
MLPVERCFCDRHNALHGTNSVTDAVRAMPGEGDDEDFSIPWFEERKYAVATI